MILHIQTHISEGLARGAERPLYDLQSCGYCPRLEFGFGEEAGYGGHCCRKHTCLEGIG
jgi:hypothetical protein